VPTTNQTIGGKALVQATTSRTQTAKANLGIATPKTIVGKSRITGTSAKTTTAKARIQGTTPKTQTSVGRIQGTAAQAVLGKARLTAATQRLQTSLSRLTNVSQQTITGQSRIGPNNLRVRPPAPPALTVSYGGFRLDESNGIQIISEPNHRDNSVFGTWSCTFRIHMEKSASVGDVDRDDAKFDGWVQAAQTALNIPRQELLVKFGKQTLRDWNFNQSAQTAFLIYPELTLLQSDRRNFVYKFTVQCQFPGNIPNNAFRRESDTQISDSLRTRRVAVMQATWTSSPGKTAVDNYNDGGDAFFTAFLFANRKDQYDNQGQWIRVDEDPVRFNDERSLCTARRVYWEVFSGRRDSMAKDIRTIENRDVFQAPSTWVATPTKTALQQYMDAGDIYYSRILPAPPDNDGAWVLVYEDPEYNDQNGIVTVTRTYHAVVRGLRQYVAEVTTDAAQLRHVKVRGTYYKTEIDAKVNYDNDIDNLIADVLKKYSITRYEARSIPKIERYGTTGKTYDFEWTIHEIAYPQGPGGYDNPNITVNTLELDGEIPWDAQTIPNGVSVNRLQKVVARFSATVDFTKNQDPASLWKGGVRAFVLNAAATRLGSDITVDLVHEQVGVGLDKNTLVGKLFLLVTGGNVLMLRMSQELILIPGIDFAARADGTQFSSFPFPDVADKILVRSYIMEYVANNASVPDPFAAESASGLAIIQTGMTAKDNWTLQNTPDADLSSNLPGWFVDRRAPKPSSVKETPTTRGVGFQTVMREVVEVWRWMENIEPAE